MIIFDLAMRAKRAAMKPSDPSTWANPPDDLAGPAREPKYYLRLEDMPAENSTPAPADSGDLSDWWAGFWTGTVCAALAFCILVVIVVVGLNIYLRSLS